MKLSEKGIYRLYNSKEYYFCDCEEDDAVSFFGLTERWEFEPDDFTGAVVLTVEEARLIRAWFDRLMIESDDLGELSVKVFDPLFYRLDRVDPV